MSRPVNVEVINKGNIPTEVLIKRFNRAVKKEGIIKEIRERRYYVKPSDKRRREKKRRLKLIKKMAQESNKQGLKNV